MENRNISDAVLKRSHRNEESIGDPILGVQAQFSEDNKDIDPAQKPNTGDWGDEEEWDENEGEENLGNDNSGGAGSTGSESTNNGSN